MATATEAVLLKFSEDELAAIDRVRGGQPRTLWIKDLCRCAVLARDAFDGPCGIRMRAVAVEEAPDALNGPQVWIADG